MELSELTACKDAARKAGKKVMDHYLGKTIISYKGKNDPVTSADLASQEILIKELNKFGYGFLSEELTDDKKRLGEKKVWIIDPLDGTLDFIQKTGEFTILVALVENGEPVLGIIYEPVKDVMYFAAKNGGSFVEHGDKSKKIVVTDENIIENIKLLVSRNHMGDIEKKFADKENIKNIFKSGSAGLKMGLISEGEGDLYICSYNKTKEWDICAGDIILREAGGILTDMDGKTFSYNRENVINENGYIASNNKSHQEIVAKLKDI